MGKKIYFLSNKNNFLLDKDIKLAPKPTKNDLICSRYEYKDIITHNFKLEKSSILNNELNIQTEIKMFEEAGLNIEKTYKISHLVKRHYIGYETLIEGFAIDKELTKEKYTKKIKKIKYIDIMILPFLSFSTLYKRKLIKEKNDLFIYIGKDEAFTTFYKDGKYLSSQKTKSLNEMLDELESRQINISYEEFLEALSTNGLDREKYSPKNYIFYEYILQTFSQIFSKINNLVLHNRSIYGFEYIDSIYIYIQDGIVIKSLTKAMQIFQNIPEIKDFNFFNKKLTFDIDILDLISAYYIQDHIDNNLNKEEFINLTIFERKIPFFKTQLGRLTLNSVVVTLLASSYPIYLEYKIYEKSTIKEELEMKKNTIINSSMGLDNLYNKKKQKLSNITKKLKEMDKKFLDLKKIASSLIKMKTNENKYTTILLQINNQLKKYSLKIDKIEQKGDRKLAIELSSDINKRDTIALFMQEFFKLGYRAVYSNEIKLSQQKYKSVITLQR